MSDDWGEQILFCTTTKIEIGVRFLYWIGYAIVRRRFSKAERCDSSSLYIFMVFKNEPVQILIFISYAFLILENQVQTV